MFQIVYHSFWFLALVLLSPIYIYRMLFQGKYKQSTLARLGLQNIPDLSGKKVIWMHSVSLGESQISEQFSKTIKEHYPDIYIVGSSCTETGQAVLKNSASIDFSFYYPADIIFLIKKLFKRLQPQAILIMETDLWPNMLLEADKRTVPVYLLNAKISESSFKAYQKFPFMNHLLLGNIDHLFVQCQAYDSRFEKLGVEGQRRSLSGNIKLDRTYPSKSHKELDALAKYLGLDRTKPILVFASSHEGEEQGFINVCHTLNKQVPALQSVFVPRHPERFQEVAQLLKKNKLTFNCYSNAEKGETLNICDYLLIDKMGVLMDIYALSDIAVVAGSFTNKVGGHNIFEPAFYAKPIIYGPWIFKQPGFHDLIQERNAAIQISNENWEASLAESISKLLKDKSLAESLGLAAQEIVNESQGIKQSIIEGLVKSSPTIFR